MVAHGFNLSTGKAESDGLYEFSTSLIYTMSSRPARARETMSKQLIIKIIRQN